MVRFGGVIAMMALAACAPSAEVNNVDVRRAATLLNDPDARSVIVSHCEADWRNADPLVLQYLAATMRVTVAATPRTYCSRMATGISEGKLQASDLANPVENGEIKPRVLAVLRPN